MRQGWTNMLPDFSHRNRLIADEVSKVIVTEDVEDDVRRGIPLLLALHPQIGLIHRISAYAVVPDWLAEKGGQHLLPGLSIAYLLARGEAISVRVNPADLVGVHDRVACVRGIIGVRTDGSLHPFFEPPIPMKIAKFAVVLRKRKCAAGQPVVYLSSSSNKPGQILFRPVLAF